MRGFARLLEPPRLRTSKAAIHRRATWLELFFDLVFVVELGGHERHLAPDSSPAPGTS